MSNLSQKLLEETYRLYSSNPIEYRDSENLKNLMLKTFPFSEETLEHTVDKIKKEIGGDRCDILLRITEHFLYR